MKHRNAPIFTDPITAYLQKNMLPFGVTGILGETGSGKTSLGMALLSLDNKYHKKERFAYAAKKIEQFNNENPYRTRALEPSKYQYFTRKGSKLFLPDKTLSGALRVEQFGLPSPNNPNIKHLPPASVVFFDEFDRFYDARSWNTDNETKQSAFDAFKTGRHNNLTFLYDGQVWAKFDVNVRRLTTALLYVKGKYDVYVPKSKHSKQMVCARTIWDLVYLTSEQFQDSVEAPENLDLSKGKKVRFIYEGDIYSQYDACSYESLWFYGIEQFTFDQHPSKGFNQAEIAQFYNQITPNKPKAVQVQAETAGKKIPAG